MTSDEQKRLQKEERLDEARARLEAAVADVFRRSDALKKGR